MQIKYSNIGDEPLTLSEVKSYCYVDHSSDDSYLTSLIKRARELAEKATDRSFVIKTIEYFEEDYPSVVTLPFPMHDEVLEVTVNGVDVLADTIMTGLTQKILTVPVAYSTSIAENGLYVKYTTIADVPEGIKEAMLKLIKSLYDNRGNEADYNSTMLMYNFESLAANYRL